MSIQSLLCHFFMGVTKHNTSHFLISITKTWTEHFPPQATPTSPKKEIMHSEKTLVWANPFTNLIKVDERESQLAP